MGRPELAVHLPEQVDEVVVRGEPVDQRTVPLGDAGPVHALHVRPPVVVAHQPPGLVEHLPPFGLRLHLHPDPFEIYLEDVRVLVLLRLAVRGHDAHLVLVDDDEPEPVTAHLHPVDRLRELVDLAGRQVDVLELRPGRLVLHPGPVVSQAPCSGLLSQTSPPLTALSCS